MNIVYYILIGLDVLVMITFIGLVTAQTAKSEGIFMGGGATGGYAKAKPGFEDFVSRWTLYLAIAFFVLTTVVTYWPKH